LMRQLGWLMLAVASCFAVVDWVTVAGRDQRLRWVSKPGTILLLVFVALTLHPGNSAQRYVFVAALLFSFAGDVFLLLGERRFRAGLAAFLAAHLAYAAGFVAGGLGRGQLPLIVIGPVVAAVAIVSLAVGSRVLRSILRSGNSGLAPSVAAYLLAISAMVALAAASGKPLALAGAVLFYASDGMIAWNRFVRPLPWSPLPVIVTYHLGQAGLVLSLAS
jgi:uncharacterized membrane protein YhhN